jgi:hypothetical protein
MWAKKLQKYTNMKKHIFMPLHLGMGYTNSNLEVSKVQQLEESKVLLPKSPLMNHHHH